MIFLYVILAILMLLLMITIHEAGHYVAGKALGFGINEFSIGFGPKLLSRRLRSGEVFSVRALPIGGFCSFVGEDDAGSAKPTADPFGEENEPGRKAEADAAGRKEAGVEAVKGVAFGAQKPWKRIIVLAAGPVFNLLSAFLFSFIYILAVGYAVPVVTETAVDPATGEPYASAFETGDVIVAVNGEDITFLSSASELIAETSDVGTTVFTVERDGKRTDITAEKHLSEDGYVFGLTMTYETRSVGVLRAAGYCFPYTFELSWAVIRSFGMLLTGGVPFTDVTGPVGTVAAIAEYAAVDSRYLLLFLPLIASNLAIFNILPIPALDGARIVFAIIEWIRRKPINAKVEGAIHAVGLLVLLAFVLVVDIVGMISRLL